MTARLTASLVFIAITWVVPSSAGAQGRGNSWKTAMRFVEMDSNHDGVIARNEWRGSDRSFEVHDWNRDGKLSGEEVRTGGRRPNGRGRGADREFDSPEREYEFDDWTAKGFAGLDHNRDGRINADEWHFSREAFRRADHNGDGAISRSEFLTEDNDDDDRDDSFPFLDANRDGRLSRDEWHGSAQRFERLDANRDGVITRGEMVGTDAPPELFSSVDVNRDRAITRDEWHWARAGFDSRDRDRDGRLTREEFMGTAAPPAPPAASQAYRSGQERGLTEGRTAGREDRERNQGWDLEGQRELETADSGYDARFGPRAEYQAGYREAFRRGYREGWGR